MKFRMLRGYLSTAYAIATISLGLAMAPRIVAVTKTAAAELPHPPVGAFPSGGTPKRATASAAKYLAGTPLMFEPDTRPGEKLGKFVGRAPGVQIAIDSTGASLLVAHPIERIKTVASTLGRKEAGLGGHSVLFGARPEYEYVPLAMKFAGANQRAKVCGVERQAAHANYFIGNDPRNWRTTVPTYAKVEVSALYPGIDLTYYGHERSIEYDLRVQSGADPRSVRLTFDGARQITVNPDGDLVIWLDRRGNSLLLRKPMIYQERAGRRVSIEGHYSISRLAKRIQVRQGHIDSVHIEISKYDRTAPITIDPVIVYNNLIGGSFNDQGKDLAIDANDNAYVTGNTLSPDFPTTPGTFQTTRQTSNPNNHNTVVYKYDKDGNLLFSTIVGGNGNDVAQGIAVDPATGNVYIDGNTSSTNFPTTPGAAQTALKGAQNAFVTGLNSTGSALNLSTYLGGSKSELAGGIALQGGNTFVTGLTFSTDFPTTPGAFQPTAHGGGDAFVSKLNPSGGLIWSALFGGSSLDRGIGIAVDPNQNVYVDGATNSNDILTTADAFQSSSLNSKQFQYGFVAIFKSDGSGILASTLFGSASNALSSTTLYSIGLNLPSIVVAGATNASDVPVTNGSKRTGLSPEEQSILLALLSSDLSKETGGTYLGGSGNDDSGGKISLSVNGNKAVLGGTTTSFDFAPVAPGQISPSPLYLSNDFSTFVPANNGLATNQVEDVAVDPTNPDRIYAGGGEAGVFFSSDGGKTWEPLVDIKQEVTTIAADPADSNHLLVGTTQNFQADISVSSDGGKTFTPLHVNVPASRFNELRFNPAVTGEIDGVASGFPSVLIKSVDNGQTFVSVPTPTKDPTAKANIEQYLTEPDGTILALDGTSGIVKVPPSGGTPTIINPDQTGNVIAGNQNAIFVGEDANLPGHASPLRISTDAGKTFQDSGLPQVGNIVGVGTNAEGKVAAEFFSLFFDIFTALSPDDGKTWHRSDYFAFQVPVSQSSKVQPAPIKFNGSTLLMGGAAAENGYLCFFPNLAIISPASCSRVADTFPTEIEGVTMDYPKIFVTYNAYGPKVASFSSSNPPPGMAAASGGPSSTNNAYPVGANIGLLALDIAASPTATPTPTATATATATATQTPTATPTTATPPPVNEKVSVTPSTLNFGKVPEETTKSKSVKIKNAGSKKKGVVVVIEGETGATSPFSLTQSCTGPLAPTASCVATVSFTPTDTMTHTATLMVMDNGEGAPQTVGMSGTGKAPKK